MQSNAILKKRKGEKLSRMKRPNIYSKRGQISFQLESEINTHDYSLPNLNIDFWWDRIQYSHGSNAACLRELAS